MIDKLLELHADGEFDEELVKEQIETILIAGNDTSTTTLSFAILMIAMHPEVQERLFQELHSVFTAQNEDTTEHHLNKLSYLDMVIKETLRLFPAGPYPVRSATADVSISNCTIPKGATIILSIYSTQRVIIESNQFKSNFFLQEFLNQIFETDSFDLKTNFFFT